MGDNFGVAPDIGWFNRQINELKRQIEALRSERRTASTTIGQGGSLVVDGGDVIMRDVDGSIIFRLGTQGLGDRGLTISRDDGTDAITLRKALSGTPQDLALLDSSGNVIFGEEILGFGMAKPFLHVPMTPVQATAGALPVGPYGVQVPIATGTFTTTHQAWWPRSNQYARFRVYISASDITTAAEIRVINVSDGGALGGFFMPAWTGVRAAGSTGLVEAISERLYLPGAPSERISIALQVRRSIGAGTLQVALIESDGV